MKCRQLNYCHDSFAALASRRARRGSVYVAILGVAMMISIIGLAALHASRMEVELVASADQIGAAEQLAQSAVEFAVTRIAVDPDWRTNYTSGQENPSNSWTSLGTTGGFRFALVDDDGDLDDDSNDTVTVRGIGRFGKATSVVSVQLQPGGAALDCLDFAFHVDDDITNVGQTITCNQIVGCNGNIITLTGSITGDAWAVGVIQGGVGGNRWQLMSPPREMPNTSDVFDYYLANGTWISINSIAGATIQNVLISANSNPYGAANPQGIYIIDCADKDLKIKNSRIAATIVAVNLNNHRVEIQEKVNWAPPSPSSPSLMVQGKLTMNWDGGSPLSEGSVGVNFNPAGSPYAGAVDSDVSDFYPGVLNGLFYTSGDLDVKKTCIVEGVLIVEDTANITGSLSVTYAFPNHDNPPPGFASGGRMRVVPRTWRRVSY